jgi:2,3-bisphosphoglycerate-dependent phosphoglycerate mutase
MAADPADRPGARVTDTPAIRPLVLLRHAQSQWNLENRFTGWADIGLTEAGREEAHRAGALLRAHDCRFDRTFTSQLQRATETLEIVLRKLGHKNIPVERSWRLNERHYGALEGLDKVAFAAEHGGDTLHRMRRGYRDRPAPLAADDPRYRRHRDAYPDLDPALLPATESLADTLARLLPYWNGTISPAIARGERVLIVSHGNTLRALLKHLGNMTEHEVEQFEIPTGRPLVVEFTPGDEFLRRDYLGIPVAAPPDKVAG